jgi:hypothetical protein
MPVTFGTVEVIPQPSSAATPASSGAATAARPASPTIDPRELAPALRQLEDRHARVRAH